MNFFCDEALKEHMKQKGKHNIVVELVTAETSDIEVSELHVYLADDKHAQVLKEKKKYRAHVFEDGEVLLPKYPLQFEENIYFKLKKFLCFKMVGYEGIKI